MQDKHAMGCKRASPHALLCSSSPPSQHRPQTRHTVSHPLFRPKYPRLSNTLTEYGIKVVLVHAHQAAEQKVSPVVGTLHYAWALRVHFLQTCL